MGHHIYYLQIGTGEGQEQLIGAGVKVFLGRDTVLDESVIGSVRFFKDVVTKNIM